MSSCTQFPTAVTALRSGSMPAVRPQTPAPGHRPVFTPGFTPVHTCFSYLFDPVTFPLRLQGTSVRSPLSPTACSWCERNQCCTACCRFVTASGGSSKSCSHRRQRWCQPSTAISLTPISNRNSTASKTGCGGFYADYGDDDDDDEHRCPPSHKRRNDNRTAVVVVVAVVQ